jgi:hypothetical protein
MKVLPNGISLAWKPVRQVSVSNRLPLAVIFSLAIFVCSTKGNPLLAQTQSATSSRDLEGDWVRTDLSGSGSFGGLSDKFEKAALTPAGAHMASSNPQRPTGIAYTENRAHGAGDPYIVVERPCAGGPFGGARSGSIPTPAPFTSLFRKMR